MHSLLLLSALCLSAVDAPEWTIQGGDGLPIAGYKKGFFIQSSDRNFALRLNGRVMVRYHLRAPSDDIGNAQLSHFFLPRVRLKTGGHAFTKDLKFLIHIDFGEGGAGLKDGYIDYRVVPGWLHLRAGQFKMPFSRQQLVSTKRLHFTERAITDDAFLGGRSIGIQAHNNIYRSPELEWGFGIFNGTDADAELAGDVLVDPSTGEGAIESGEFINFPDKLRPTFVARLGYNYGKTKGYHEGDAEGGPLRFGVGASAALTFDLEKSNQGLMRAEVDGVLKAYGFAATAAFFISTHQIGGGWESQRLHRFGARGSASFLIADLVMPAVRYAFVDDQQTWTLHEVMGGVSVLFFDHELKAIAELGAQIEDIPGAPEIDLLFSAQIQLAF